MLLIALTRGFCKSSGSLRMSSAYGATSEEHESKIILNLSFEVSGGENMCLKTFIHSVLESICSDNS